MEGRCKREEERGHALDKKERANQRAVGAQWDRQVAARLTQTHQGLDSIYPVKESQQPELHETRVIHEGKPALPLDTVIPMVPASTHPQEMPAPSEASKRTAKDKHMRFHRKAPTSGGLPRPKHGSRGEYGGHTGYGGIAPDEAGHTAIHTQKGMTAGVRREIENVPDEARGSQRIQRIAAEIATIDFTPPNTPPDPRITHSKGLAHLREREAAGGSFGGAPTLAGRAFLPARIDERLRKKLDVDELMHQAERASARPEKMDPRHPAAISEATPTETSQRLLATGQIDLSTLEQSMKLPAAVAGSRYANDQALQSVFTGWFRAKFPQHECRICRRTWQRLWFTAFDDKLVSREAPGRDGLRMSDHLLGEMRATQIWPSQPRGVSSKPDAEGQQEKTPARRPRWRQAILAISNEKGPVVLLKKVYATHPHDLTVWQDRFDRKISASIAHADAHPLSAVPLEGLTKQHACDHKREVITNADSIHESINDKDMKGEPASGGDVAGEKTTRAAPGPEPGASSTQTASS